MKRKIMKDPEIKTCIRCGIPSRFDICRSCAELMGDLHFRQQFYDGRYSSYNVDHGMAEFEFVEKYLYPGCLVLEIGGGAGHLSNHCKFFTKNVVTLDFSTHMIQTSRQKYPELDVFIADAEKYLPFKEASFDVVICSEAFEHFYDVSGNIQEIYRILKKTGIYIIKTPNRVVEDIYNIFGRKNNYYHKSFHPSTQSKASLKKLLVTYGFQPVFIHQKGLSDSQKKKIPWKPAVNSVECALRYVPCCIQPSLICIAKKRLT